MNNHLIAEINHESIIKYLISSIDINLLTNISDQSNIITKYIFNIKKDEFETKIILLSYEQSEFMGNIILLINLFNLTKQYKKNNLNLSNYFNIIDDFQFLLLQHILKLIKIISDAIKLEKSNKEFKNNLLDYSIFCINNLNDLTIDKIKNKIKDIEFIQNNMKRLENIELQLVNKIKILSESINTQDIQILNINKKLSDTSSNNYKISENSNQSNEQSDEQSNEQSDEQSNEQSDEQSNEQSDDSLKQLLEQSNEQSDIKSDDSLKQSLEYFNDDDFKFFDDNIVNNNSKFKIDLSSIKK
jgi:hypothetical protein